MKTAVQTQGDAPAAVDIESSAALTPELVAQLYTHTRSLVWGFPAGSLVLAAFLWKYVHTPSLLAWVGTILLVSYWRRRLI